MTGISRGRRGRASRLCLVVAGATVVAACGGRARTRAAAEPSVARVIPLAEAIVLETSGPPPSDTAVEFITGELRVIVLRHGPPENVEFAEVSFPPRAFVGDSGHIVKVEVRPRPGVYGLDIITSLPLAQEPTVTFKYARYFSAPARARQVYGNDVAYERALHVGQLIPSGPLLTLLPSTRPAADNLRGPVPAPGTYLVAAPVK
jgi:hypothetical protein